MEFRRPLSNIWPPDTIPIPMNDLSTKWGTYEISYGLHLNTPRPISAFNLKQDYITRTYADNIEHSQRSGCTSTAIALRLQDAHAAVLLQVPLTLRVHLEKEYEGVAALVKGLLNVLRETVGCFPSQTDSINA